MSGEQPQRDPKGKRSNQNSFNFPSQKFIFITVRRNGSNNRIYYCKQCMNI